MTSERPSGGARGPDPLAQARDQGIKMDLTAKREPFVMRGDDWYNKPLDYKVVIYEPNHETGIAKITLNRPEAMNALSLQLEAELFHALKVAEKDIDIDVIIIKGAGRCFSAGHDLGGANWGVPEPDLGSQYVGSTHWPRFCIQRTWQIWELSKVVIAQTHGYCIGGATTLASSCDLLVTTPDCEFSYGPIKNQGAPDTMWFPWLLPIMKAREMAFTGDAFTGQQLYEWGAANYAVPESDIDEFTEIFARRIGLTSWQANTLRKRAIQKAYEIMGIRAALESSPPMNTAMAQVPKFREMSEFRRQHSLREWVAARDNPYRELKAKEEEILARAKGAKKG